MAYSGLLRTAATASTNPDPNTLSTKNPFSSPYVDRYTASSAWKLQAATNSTAIVSRDPNAGFNYTAPTFAFIPSAGSATTYTVTFWTYIPLATTWVKLQGQNFSLTGHCNVLLQNNAYPMQGHGPVFIQLSSISSGTIDIYYDNGQLSPL